MGLHFGFDDGWGASRVDLMMNALSRGVEDYVRRSPPIKKVRRSLPIKKLGVVFDYAD